jgi:hypothetical protein
MRKFIVLDQSLRDLGGHHFDYASQTLRAAKAAGFDVLLACHRRFQAGAFLPSGCRVLPLFRHHTYSRYSDFTGIQAILEDEQKDSLARRMVDYCKSKLHERGREKRVASFAKGCQRMFGSANIRPGDQILATTMSELDLLGLARFLASEDGIPRVDWHLQFHFNIFAGREPEYAAQTDRVERLRSRFHEALSKATQHRLHFYNTSDLLAHQYNRLGVASFEPLAYPVNPVFRNRVRNRELTHESAIRITCAGDNRKEKGFTQLNGILADLWDDCFSTSRAQLVVQSRTCDKRQSLQRADWPVEYASGVSEVQYPLETNQYVDLIRRAGIGLFLYDPRHYYARRAGILGEFLTAGVPVIAPAGCWLAEQIAESVYRYQLELGDRHGVVAREEVASANWRKQGRAESNTVGSDLIFGSTSDAISTDLACPPGANQMLVKFRWSAAASAGMYIQLDTIQRDMLDRQIARFSTIVGQGGMKVTPMLVPITDGATTIEIRWTNAYHDSLVQVHAVQFDFLATPSNCPLGAVGLIAANKDQVSLLLRDMISNHEHYRDSAQQFAEDWFQRHDPQAVIQQLLARTSASTLQGAA